MVILPSYPCDTSIRYGYIPTHVEPVFDMAKYVSEKKKRKIEGEHAEHKRRTCKSHPYLRLKKPETQKSARSPRAPGMGYEAKAWAF